MKESSGQQGRYSWPVSRMSYQKSAANSDRKLDLATNLLILKLDSRLRATAPAIEDDQADPRALSSFSRICTDKQCLRARADDILPLRLFAT